MFNKQRMILCKNGGVLIAQRLFKCRRLISKQKKREEKKKLVPKKRRILLGARKQNTGG